LNSALKAKKGSTSHGTQNLHVHYSVLIA